MQFCTPFYVLPDTTPKSGLSGMLPFLQLNPDARVQLCPVSQWKTPRIFPTGPPWCSLADRTTCSIPSPGIIRFQGSTQLPLNSSRRVGVEGVTPVIAETPGGPCRQKTHQKKFIITKKPNKTQLCHPEALPGQEVQGMCSPCHDTVPAWCCTDGYGGVL